MIGRRVLATRPQPGADRTAERLRALGLVPVVMPLTEDSGAAAWLAGSDTRSGACHQPASLPFGSGCCRCAFGHPVRVTGKATAASAREAGFLDVKETGGDVSRLMAALSSQINPGIRVLYLAGRVRRPELEKYLAGKGADLTAVEVYDTISVSYSTDKIRALNTDGELAAVLLTSVNCASRLGELTKGIDPSQAIGNAVLICLFEPYRRNGENDVIKLHSDSLRAN